jgi:hypothetical protein
MPEQGDAVAVATEAINVLLNPLQRDYHVVRAVQAAGARRVGCLGRGEETQRSLAELHIHHHLPSRPILSSQGETS